MIKHFSIIGTGNVGTRLSIALVTGGYVIDFIYDTSIINAKKLESAINRLDTQQEKFELTDRIEDLFKSDLIVLAVPDDSIPELVKEISEFPINRSPLIVHTSGSVTLNELAPLKDKGYNTGVLYPLMTLSRSKPIEFNIIPFFIEGDDKYAEELIVEIINSFGAEFTICDSHQRLRFHLAAVFCSNFTNYILSLGSEIAVRHFNYLLPASIETIRKSFLTSPDNARTGPAVREDFTTIEKHMKLLEDIGLEEHKEVYELITKNIIKRNVKL